MPKKATIQKLPQELTFREELGLSLEHMATFCGVSVSMLGMIESKRRNWPTGNLNHIKLQMALTQVQQQEPAEGELPAPSERQLDVIHRQIRELEYKHSSLQLELKKMQFRYTQASQLFRVCQKLKPEFPTPNTLESTGLDLWEKKSIRRMEDNSLLLQQRLSIQIDELKRSIEMLKGLVEG